MTAAGGHVEKNIYKLNWSKHKEPETFSLVSSTSVIKAEDDGRKSIEKNPFFTKLGDCGKSKIHKGELFKDHLIFEAIGVTEELNAYIGYRSCRWNDNGLAREYVRDDEKLTPLAEKLLKIQLVLVDVMDIVYHLHPSNSSVDKKKPPVSRTTAKITNRDVADLEILIAHYGTLLPPLENIIIPGGGKASAALHVAKSICRRCERILVAAFKDMEYETDLLAFINRLSTYLSQAARISAKFANRSETIYKLHVKGDGGTISDK